MLKSHFLGFWADWSSILWNTFGLFGWESKQSNETFETEEENKENAQTRALAKTCCQGTCCKGWRQLNYYCHTHPYSFTRIRCLTHSTIQELDWSASIKYFVVILSFLCSVVFVPIISFCTKLRNKVARLIDFFLRSCLIWIFVFKKIDTELFYELH